MTDTNRDLIVALTHDAELRGLDPIDLAVARLLTRPQVARAIAGATLNVR